MTSHPETQLATSDPKRVPAGQGRSILQPHAACANPIHVEILQCTRGLYVPACTSATIRHTLCPLSPDQWVAPNAAAPAHWTVGALHANVRDMLLLPMQEPTIVRALLPQLFATAIKLL